MGYLLSGLLSSFKCHHQGRSQPLTPGWARKDISSMFPHFPVVSFVFSQIFFIFFLILIFRVGGSPTRKGPGYATGHHVKRFSPTLIYFTRIAMNDIYIYTNPISHIPTPQ